MSLATRTAKRAMSSAPRIRSAVMIPDAAASTYSTRAPQLVGALPSRTLYNQNPH